jgi:multiple sugar transport system permease protein
MMAASVLSMLPMLILYFLTQKTMIQGVTMTGIKG